GFQIRGTRAGACPQTRVRRGEPSISGRSQRGSTGVMTGRGEGEAPEAAGGLTCHTPVLLSAALEALQPKDGERYIDCTFGAGGYSRAILESADCELLALDRDPQTVGLAADLAADFPKRFRFTSSAFGQVEEVAESAGFVPADAVIFDLGVS